MSKFLEIFGRAIGVNTAGIIWQWINDSLTTDSENTQLERALEEVSMGNFDQAAEEIKHYLLEFPQSIPGRMAAAAICIENSDLASAIENLQSVYYRQPNNTIALYVLGHCYERLEKESDAVAFYQDCLKFKNYLDLPRQRLAAIYLKNNQIERAIEEYTKQQLEYPGDIKTIILLGNLHMLNNDYESAIESFNNAILIHPDNFNSNAENEELKAILEEYDGHYKGVDYVTNLIDETPEAADLYVQRADLLMEIGETADAIVNYEKALKIQPNYLEAMVKLGSMHVSIGNEAIASERFNKAVEINDEIVDAYVGLAQAELLAGRKSQAYSTLGLAESIHQNSAVLFAEAARLRVAAALHEVSENEHIENDDKQSGQLVISVFRKEYQSNPNNQAIAYGFGLILMRFSKFEEAKYVFEEITKSNPTNHRAKSRCAICCVELGQRSETLKWLRSKTRITTELIDLHYKTAILYADRKKFMVALDTTNARLESAFDTDENASTLIEVLQNLGVLDRAYACWNTLGEMSRIAVDLAV